MVQSTTYGIISDVHSDPRLVTPAIAVLKKLGAQQLILNGDIGERQATLQASQDYVAQILAAVVKSGLESFVQPGSHETIGAFAPVLNHYIERYAQMHSTFALPKIEHPDHHLVFLPGSDFLSDGEYQLGDRPEISSGLYICAAQGLIPYSPQAYGFLQAREKDVTLLQYINMHDLRALVTDGPKTIVVCHVPRKFDSLESAVDVAYFAEHPDGTVQPGITFESALRQQYGPLSFTDVRLLAAQRKLTLKRENRGNTSLRDLYATLGITKAVSGHFHESGHRAHDASGNPLAPDALVDTLYWNTGCLDLGQTGLLTVADGRVSYRNVRLQDYL